MSHQKSSRNHLTTLRKLQHQQPIMFARVADYYLQIGKVKSAARTLHEGLKKFPEYSTAWVVKGNMHLMMNETALAEKAFLKGLELEPENCYAHKRCSEIASERNDYHAHLHHIKALAELNPLDGHLQKMFQLENLRRIAIDEQILSQDTANNMKLSDLRLVLQDQNLLPDFWQRKDRLDVEELFKGIFEDQASSGNEPDSLEQAPAPDPGNSADSSQLAESENVSASSVTADDQPDQTVGQPDQDQAEADQTDDCDPSSKSPTSDQAPDIDQTQPEVIEAQSESSAEKEPPQAEPTETIDLTAGQPPGADDARQQLAAIAEQVTGKSRKKLKLKASNQKPWQINTESLAELYASQGEIRQAIGVYQNLIDREPENRHFQKRLIELIDQQTKD